MLLASLFLALGFGLWTAGTASANCPASDPYCMGGGPPPTSPPATSPPHTSPPVTQHPSSGVQSTQPPVNRTPVTNPPRRTSPVTRTPVVSQTPATQPADQTIAETPAALSPSPAIAVSGTAPPVGGGVASSSATPPASSSSGAGTVLWAFGIGAAAVGIALGARATLAGAPASSTALPQA